MIREFPHHIHAWAHVDHYALSKGFLNNNFDFFHPETLTANKQFPSSKHPKKLTPITSVDFPIVQFTAAVVMKISGNEEPVVYRVLMLLLASLGLLYLFKIGYFFSQQSILSILLPMVLIFSPVYLDYQIGFLPTIAAMSCLFAGIYHFLVYQRETSQKQLIISVIWLSLAAAIRLPFAIPLIAILGHQFLLILKKKSSIKTILIIGCGLVLPVLYFFYNQYLRAEYGSLFLGSPLYARNLEELISNFTEACQNWHFHYFHPLQWAILLTALVALPVGRVLIQKLPSQLKQLVDIALICGLGVFLYMILMSRQLVHHDYYALDTFIPFLIIVGIIGINHFVKITRTPYFFSFVFLFVLIYILPKNIDLLNERRSVDYSQPYTQMYENYSHLEELLDRNKITPSTPLLVLDPMAPNMPFLLSNFQGANVMRFKHQSFEEFMNSSYGYVILRSSLFYSDFWKINNKILQKTQLVDYGFGIFLLKVETTASKNVFDWLEINPEQPMKVSTLEAVQDVEVVKDSGTCNSEFGVTYRDTLHGEQFRLASFSFKLKKEQNTEALWHLHIYSDQEELFNEYLQIKTTSETFEREIIIPNDLNTWYISSYLYNPNNNTIHYQDFEVKYY